MSLKIEFVEKAGRKGANVAAVCREFGISRETGHKWLRRFRELGYDGLEEWSRRPSKHPLATAEEIVMAVLKAREAHPRWGPTTLVDLLRGRFKRETPSRATVARILKRFGQVRRRRRKAPVSIVEQAPIVEVKAPNDLWTVDFKGWWRTGDGQRCDPLTIRDAYSRYVLTARIVDATSTAATRTEFERLFRRCGIPRAIQSDNGEPFICVQSRAGLTRLSAWWVSLGIRIVRSRSGCPQDNGGHERMHRDLKGDVEDHPRANRLQQQSALDRWRQEFNHVRPHQALHGKTPTELYRPGQRRSLRPLIWPYPMTWAVKRAYGPDGCVTLNGESRHLGRAFIGHLVGIEPLREGLGRAWLHDVDVGEVHFSPPVAVIDAACVRFMKRTNRDPKRSTSLTAT